jgi:hypothetical protein
VPTQISGFTATAVAAGCYHSLALEADGTVWAWGNNSNGELGIGGAAAGTCAGFGGGGNNCSEQPVQVPGMTNVIAIAAGVAFSLALKSDGTVWAWGENYGNAPVQVPGLTGVTGISAGSYHALAVEADGTVWAWGQDIYDSLGPGATGTTYVPVQVPGLTDIVAVGAGGWHSLALSADGTVWAWGRNSEGQIGTGTPTTSGCDCVPAPVQVPGLANVTMVVGGLLSSFALETDGSVYAWGYNEDGELGNGTFSSGSATPTQVSGLAGVTSIAAGAYHVLAIVGSPLSVTSTGLPGATLGTAYATALTATGGTSPYTWAVTSGTLPPGLSLNASTGSISGTPVLTGTFGFTAQVTDSTSPAPQTATTQLSIQVGTGTAGTTITGSYSGSLVIGPGVTSIDDATITGSVKITAGAVVSIQGSQIEGSLTADSATGLALCSTTVNDPFTVKDSTGPVLAGGTAGSPCDADTIDGPVTLTANTDGVQISGASIGGATSIKDNTGGTLISGNTIMGLLACSGNNPPPADNGTPNIASGTVSGQCTSLT